MSGNKGIRISEASGIFPVSVAMRACDVEHYEATIRGMQSGPETYICQK